MNLSPNPSTNSTDLKLSNAQHHPSSSSTSSPLPLIQSHSVTLQIWDTAGQERFQSLGVSFYRGSDVAVLVYDITDHSSFDHLQLWMEEFLAYATPKNVDCFPFLILGNKYDLSSTKRQVTTNEIKQWCQERGNLLFYEVSAKEAKNVERGFQEIVEQVLTQQIKEQQMQKQM